MKVLVTGAKGQLGWEIAYEFSKDHCVIGLGREELDIRSNEAIGYYMQYIQPDIVINCASFTHVDGCERNKKLAMDVNAYGAKNLATVCQQMHILLVHISTDYIFSGENRIPYEELDSPKPMNTYGYSKWLGEQYIRSICSRYYILRTSWLFGTHGQNFVKKIICQIPYRDTLHVVEDQIGSPTYTKDFINMLRGVITSNQHGIYHIANRGSCSRYEFAQTIMTYLKGETPKVLPIQSEEIPMAAIRPKYSALSSTKAQLLCGMIMPTWQKALKRFMDTEMMCI